MWEDLQITNRLLYQLSYVGFQQVTDFLYPIRIPCLRDYRHVKDIISFLSTLASPALQRVP